MSRFRARLTYANVVSTLALFLALGGAGAYAANQLAPKSVGAKQLRPGAVTPDKIRKNAVTAPKIQALAVKNGKLAGGAVDGAKLAEGAVTAEKLANGAITAEKIGPEEVTGAKVNESTLGQVPSAAKADFASSAESANPAAFAKVDADGKVDPSFAKGISSGDVTQGTSGIYCITVPSFTPRGAQVTPRYNGSGEINAFVTVGGTVACAAPQVEVQIFKGAVLLPSSFYVAFYR